MSGLRGEIPWPEGDPFRVFSDSKRFHFQDWELARRNVRANCISPGLVFTQMTKRSLEMLSAEHVERLKASYPLGPGTPQDVARAAVFLLAPATRWITGADLAVDGGFTAQ